MFKILRNAEKMLESLEVNNIEYCIFLNSRFAGPMPYVHRNPLFSHMFQVFLCAMCQ